MKRRHALIALPLAALALTAWSSAADDTSHTGIIQICGAEARPLTTAGPTHLTIESGMGDGGFPIRTKSPEAQAWFNYGIKLFHAFYHADAKVAFDKAAAADPDCAMCLWGQALSHGPTQNFDITDDQTKAALDMARKARGAAQTPFEVQLTDAMVARYTPVDQDRKESGGVPYNFMGLERDFAAAMQAAGRADTGNVDLSLIGAEAYLTVWRRGDKSAADKAIAIVEPILKREPNNTAAIHYYIHATEFAGKPALALPYALRLAGLAPKASHLVHMAAHTFIHVGLYEEAASVNAEALKVDADHLIATNTPGPLSTAYYYGHNLRFGMSGALMSGDGPLALRFADDLHRAYPDNSFMGDSLSAADGQMYVIYGRYAPDRMLALTEPAQSRTDALAFFHYGRGEAFAARRDLAGMKREAALIASDDNLLPKLAGSVLEGRIAMLEGRYDDAIAAFGRAAHVQEVQIKDSMDPPTWWYPVRRSIAAANLKAGRYEQAASEAEKSLEAWPADPLALLVLSKAEDGLKKASDAQGHLRDAEKAWHGDLSTVAIDTI